jgi:hypothetical protein
MKYLKCVLTILILSILSTSKIYAHGGPGFITPYCIVGFNDDDLIERCGSAFPNIKTKLFEEYESYKHRNKQSFLKIEEYCESHIQKTYDIYAVKPEEKSLLKEGATQYIKLMWDETANSSDFYARCEDRIDYYSSSKSDIALQQIEEINKLSANILFMMAIDKNFRLKPPAWIEANYQRDRNWDYGDMAWVVKGFKIEKREEKSSNCIGKSIEQCIENYGRKPDKRISVGQDKEELVYFGTKLLYEGTTNHNFSKGLEQERLIAKKVLL